VVTVQGVYEKRGQVGAALVRDLPKSHERYFLWTSDCPIDHRMVQHVVLQGTTCTSNIVTDFRYKQRWHEQLGMNVHRCFAKVADEVFADILPHLKPGASVLLTGHSLGGSTALLLAMMLHLEGFDVQQVVTFGSPKVTDRAGADRLRAVLPILRIVHEADMVAPCPSAPLKDRKVGRWAHAGDLVILIDDRRIRKSAKSDLPELRFCYLKGEAAEAWHVSSFWQQQYLKDPGAHRMQRYVSEICQRGSSRTQVPYERRHEHLRISNKWAPDCISRDSEYASLLQFSTYFLNQNAMGSLLSSMQPQGEHPTGLLLLDKDRQFPMATGQRFYKAI